MKIALIGASGGSGKEFLKVALNKGHEVKALVRSPEKLKDFKNEALQITQGDVLNFQAVRKTLEGTDIVVSLFGQVKDSPANLQTQGTQNLVEAMKKLKIDRIISLSGGGLPFPEKDEPKFVDHLIRGIMKLAVPKVLNDAKQHAEVLKNSGLAWSIVRAPRLTHDAAKGAYRIGWVGVNSGTKLARADLAHFIMKEVEEPQFNQQMPFVSY
jgi:putative NADH-flavin reductase